MKRPGDHSDSRLRLPEFSRRQFLQTIGGGLASVGLAQLEAGEHKSQGAHFRPRARRVIQLFMNGGASPMDLFDHKPLLGERHGKAFDPGGGQRVEAATSEPGKVLGSPFEFRRHGQSGRWVSNVLPHLAGHVDELAFCMAMTSRTNVHGPGSYLMNTGFLLPGFPCMGAWVGYALGSLSDNLPAFVVLPDAKGLPYNQRGNFGAGFLPVVHQGTVISSGEEIGLPHLQPGSSVGFITPEAEREGLSLLGEMNRKHLALHDGDTRLDARIRTYELAAKLQLSAPEAFDLKSEQPTVRTAYGLDDAVTADFGRRCLLARRLIERGVRMVQVWSGAGGPTGNWDNHGSIAKELPPMAQSIDRPIAALLADLKSRGLLEDTLVLWNTEFGRMPFSQGSDGRDHNGGTFVGWMAGAGVRAGVAVGESDEWGWKAMRDPVSTYDFHATVLHLLGLDHERLTVRHNGADRRLTDVHGHVVSALVA